MNETEDVMLKVFTLIGVVAAPFLLAACETSAIDDQLGQIERNPGQGSAFAKALHKEYIGLARSFQQGKFPSEALFWGDKSAKAGTGAEPPWEAVENQGLPPLAGVLMPYSNVTGATWSAV